MVRKILGIAIVTSPLMVLLLLIGIKLAWWVPLAVLGGALLMAVVFWIGIKVGNF